ncbi:hypothetical protein WICPIJ_005211 [Wickerhamomyces pijperi]|uniref:Uncharacterized protein n=1 Tax=Wickerhamomyces pijperi TaxID=599730 RepID=A0A9P8Q416_WICPI|nr:hypothetical protein WICPIJ_005211 [Wickerhamomyces pijperi]
MFWRTKATRGCLLMMLHISDSDIGLLLVSPIRDPMTPRTIISNDDRSLKCEGFGSVVDILRNSLGLGDHAKGIVTVVNGNTRIPNQDSFT